MTIEDREVALIQVECLVSHLGCRQAPGQSVEQHGEVTVGDLQPGDEARTSGTRVVELRCQRASDS